MIVPAERKLSDYEDILRLPHPEPKTRPRMTMQSRAAQFSPFAALTGYEGLIDERARYVDARLELDDSQRDALNDRLRLLNERIREEPPVSMVYFAPDAFKPGGSYQTVTGIVKKIDPVMGLVIFTAGEKIRMEDLYSISGPLFERIGE